MARKKIPTIFVSYSFSDGGERARQVARELEKLHIGYFLAWEHADDDNLNETVDHQLDACRVLILVLSDASLSSGWVGYEVGRVKTRGVLILAVTQSPKLIVPGYLTSEGVEHVRQVSTLGAYLPKDIAKKEYWWDFDHDEVRLRLPSNRNVVVRVTQIALNDYFHNPDTRREAERSFEEHWQWIEEIAADLYRLDRAQFEVLITSDELEKHAGP